MEEEDRGREGRGGRGQREGEQMEREGEETRRGACSNIKSNAQKPK